MTLKKVDNTGLLSLEIIFPYNLKIKLS